MFLGEVSSHKTEEVSRILEDLKPSARLGE